MLKKIVSDIFKRKITLLSSRPAMGKMAFTSEVIFEGLKNNRKILIVTLENDENYFLSHFVSRISELIVKDVYSVYYPYRGSSKEYDNNIDYLKIIDAIKYIKKSQLYICSDLYFEIDIVDYLLEFNKEENFDLVVINNLDLLINKSKYLVDEIMIKLGDLNSVLIWNLVSRNVECRKEVFLNDINNYDNICEFIESNIVLYRDVNKFYDIIKIVDYKNSVEFEVNYLKEFDRLK